MTKEPERTKGLMDEAVQAMGMAHAPYSGFRVGAALLAVDGRIFRGCNVENASYGLTICAERSAVGAAVAAGCRRFVALAIACDARQLPYPCGACLQVLAEFCGAAFPIRLIATRGRRRSKSVRLGQLLPQAFRLNLRRRGRGCAKPDLASLQFGVAARRRGRTL